MGLRFTKLLAALLAGAGGTASLRFATANNYHPWALSSWNITNPSGAVPNVDIFQSDTQFIGTDFTTLTPAITNQIIQSNLGVKNTGNSLSIIEMAVNYNGVTVGMTLSGASTATIADSATVLFDAMPSTLFGGATKFAKGTSLQYRVRFRTTTGATTKYPNTGQRNVTTQVHFYCDPRMVNVTGGGIMGTGTLSYTMVSATATSATASGNTVTLVVPSTAAFTNGLSYQISGATDTNYNGVFAVTVVDGTHLQYTASSTPGATTAGTVVCAARNGQDANFGAVIHMFSLGNHTSPAPIFTGDSKTYGTGDSATATNALGMTRALFANPATGSTVVWPGCNFGHPSGVAADITTSAGGSLANLQLLMGYGTHAVVGYGTNAINTTAQQSHYTQIRALGISKIIQRSLTPRTTTTAPTDPVSITSLTTDGSTTTVTGTMADTSGLIEGQSYPISGATPAVYNGTFAIHIVNGTTFTYTAPSVPGSNATGTLYLNDQYRTTKYQTPNTGSGWGVGLAADTFEQTLRGWVSTDANLTYYQSLGERASSTLGTANYWLWAVNGTVNYATSDGLHEGGTAPGYELNINNGTVTTQAGGTVTQSLRALIASLT